MPEGLSSLKLTEDPIFKLTCNQELWISKLEGIQDVTRDARKGPWHKWMLATVIQIIDNFTLQNTLNTHVAFHNLISYTENCGVEHTPLYRKLKKEGL